MVRYQQSVRTSDVTNAHAALEIIAGPQGCRVFGIKVCVASAVLTVLGVGRPAAQGITPTTPTTFPCIDGDASVKSQSKIALAWATSPTAPATFFDRVSTTAAIGFIRDFLFPQGIWIPANGSLTLHNITGGAVLDATVDIQEQAS